MGGFRNFAISFTIISILAGCLTSYCVAFEHGGPIAVTWGWLLVGVMSTIIALAMAEIASAYPTAGGLYYWASKIGQPRLGLGHRLVQPHRPGCRHRVDRLRARDLRAGALHLLVRLRRARMDDCRRVVQRSVVHPLRAFLLAAVLINVFDIRITSGLNMISAWWHMAGVAIIVDRPDRRPRSSSVPLVRVHARRVNNSGYGGGYDGVHQRRVLVRLRSRPADGRSTR